jgi:protein-S-isoprenylcysteine O-methyltransferase Ste14
MTWSDLSAAEWSALQRAGLLLMPLGLALVLVLAVKPSPRQATAAMVAFLWQVPALLLLHILAGHFGWWQFPGARNALMGLPIDVWIGWAIWWGPVAALLLRWLRPLYIVVLAVLLDLGSMPWLAPLVVLSDNWLLGEVAALAICLVPALLIATLTWHDRRPQWRAVLHAFGWGGYLFLVIPAAVLGYEGRDYFEFMRLPAGLFDTVLLVAALLLLFVGVAATAEFARTGQGTPIPFDPPKQVVSSGPYAFIANPMQIISALLMLVLALYARSVGLGVIAVAFALFDAVYAHWYNTAHIAHAMPQAWDRFNGAVPLWRPRWRPYVAGEAEVMISRDGPARWVWDRVWPRAGLHHGVRVRDREDADGLRLRYRRPADGIDEHGLVAAARLLEHAPLPVAVLGWLLRFPGIAAVLQLASGFAVHCWRHGIFKRP